MKKKRSALKSRNPVAKAVRRLKPKKLESKKRYQRHSVREEE